MAEKQDHLSKQLQHDLDSLGFTSKKLKRAKEAFTWLILLSLTICLSLYIAIFLYWLPLEVLDILTNDQNYLFRASLPFFNFIPGFLFVIIGAIHLVSVMNRKLYPACTAAMVLQHYRKILKSRYEKGSASERFSSLSQYKKFFIGEEFYALPLKDAIIYLSKSEDNFAKGFFIIAGSLSLLLMIPDFTNYKILNEKEFIYRSYGSFTTKRLPLSEIRSVETGCYVTQGRKSKLTAEYTINFNDGSSINLFSSDVRRSDQIPGNELNHNLDAEIQIDNIVRKMNKPITAARIINPSTLIKNEHKPLYNLECVARLHEYFPGREDDAIKLLRIQENLINK